MRMAVGPLRQALVCATACQPGGKTPPRAVGQRVIVEEPDIRAPPDEAGVEVWADDDADKRQQHGYMLGKTAAFVRYLISHAVVVRLFCATKQKLMRLHVSINRQDH